jgi:hypothetical protein
MTVKLLGAVESEHDIVRLMETLAELVSPHWPSLWSGEGREFVALNCMLPVPHGSVPLVHGRGPCEFWITGTLQETLRAADEAALPNQPGFTLKVESFVKFDDGTSQQTNFNYHRTYLPV